MIFDGEPDVQPFDNGFRQQQRLPTALREPAELVCRVENLIAAAIQHDRAEHGSTARFGTMSFRCKAVHVSAIARQADGALEVHPLTFKLPTEPRGISIVAHTNGNL